MRIAICAIDICTERKICIADQLTNVTRNAQHNVHVLRCLHAAPLTCRATSLFTVYLFCTQIHTIKMSEEHIEEIDTQTMKKAAMTDSERYDLCARLDQELEDFIDGLEKKQYTEAWPEDRWEEV